jgi:hypothetical protein
VHDVSRARFRHSFLKGPTDLFGYTLSLRNVLLDDFISQLDTLRDDIIEGTHARMFSSALLSRVVAWRLFGP